MILISRLFGGLMDALSRIPAVVWLIVVCGAIAWYGLHQSTKAKQALYTYQQQAAVDKATAAQKALDLQRALTVANNKIQDEISARSIARSAARIVVSQRLRAAATVSTGDPVQDAARASCRGLEAPANAIIPDTARDALVQLATDADDIASRLTACQSYVRNVLELQ